MRTQRADEELSGLAKVARLCAVTTAYIDPSAASQTPRIILINALSRSPLHVQLPLLRCAVPQIEIDQTLIRNPAFFGEFAEVLDRKLAIVTVGLCTKTKESCSPPS
jgi:hypothetical protein